VQEFHSRSHHCDAVMIGRLRAIGTIYEGTSNMQLQTIAKNLVNSSAGAVYVPAVSA
jgi:alkylation response protein AidB-like acyl-CoA dehydrogenase